MISTDTWSNFLLEGKIAPVDKLEPIGIRPMPAPQPSTISTISSIKADPAPISFRPELVLPKIHFMIPLLEIQKELDELSKEETKVIGKDIQNHLNLVKQLNTARIQQLQELAKELSSRSTWSKFLTVAQYITTFSTFALGLTLGPASLVGAAFIAGGGLGLFNRVMTDAGAYRTVAAYCNYSKQSQIAIEKNIDFAAQTLSTGLIIGSTIYSFYLTGPALSSEFIKQSAKKVSWEKAKSLIATNDSSWKAAMAVTSTVSSGAQHGARIVVAKDDYNIAHLNANLKQLQNRVDLLKYDSQHSAKEIDQWVKLSEKISEITKEAIR